MSKKLIVALGVLCFAFLGTASAAVENIKVSGDINTEAVNRDLSLGSKLSNTKDKEDFFLSQVRVQFDADLTEEVSAVVRLLDERMWGIEDTNADDESLDLDLAYVTLKEFLYQPLTVMVGRQNLRYGNGFIIGDPDTNRIVATTNINNVNFADLSLRKSFDAVRLIFDYSPYTVDLVYALTDENIIDTSDDAYVTGVNIAYEWDSFYGITEGYVFYAGGRANTQVVESEDDTIVIGTRTQFNPSDKLTLGLEGACQLGDYAPSATGQTLHRSAFAGQLITEYRFLTDYNPKIGLLYTYTSGESNDGDNNYGAWDPLYEDQSPAELANILLAQSNIQCLTLTGSIMPREDIVLGIEYSYARLNEHLTSTSLPGATATAVAGNNYVVRTDKRYLGDEIDFYALYDYTEDVQLKLKGAIFIPGDVFVHDNDNAAYSLRLGLSLDF